MHFPARRILILLAAFTAVSNAYVGKWHSFTNKEQVSSLISHQGFLYAGTLGGIRRINPLTLQEADYDNLDGLLDCQIAGLAEDGYGTLWAVSQSGYVYSLSGDAWEVSGRSYAAEQWTMNSRAVLASGRYLFLGSAKGLTIFDVVQKVSQANLTRFGDSTGISVISLLRRADTLYIGTPNGVFKAGVDFNNPVNPAQGYVNLADTAWKQVPLSFLDSSGNPRQYNFLEFIGDSLATFGPGMELQAPIPIKTFSGQPAVIGATSFPNMTTLTSAVVFNGSKAFVGGGEGLLVSSNPAANNPSLSPISTLSTFPRDTVANIAAQAKIWGQSAQGLYQLDPQTGDTLFFASVNPYFGVADVELLNRHLRNLKLAPNGDVYIGSWGGGLIRYRNAQQTFWTPQNNPCILEVQPNFPVVQGVSNVFNNGMFFSMLKVQPSTDNQLVYLNTSTDQITCMDSNVTGVYANALRVFSDSLVGVGSEAGVVFYKMREGAGSPTLISLQLWTIPGSANGTWGLAADRFGQPWALIGNQLAYVDKDSLDSAYANQWLPERRTFTTVTGFAGTNCYSLESDPLGSLWAGCSNGLFYIVPAASGGIANVERYGLDDGLLSLSISDISVDPTNGHIWIATDHGVSMLESASQPPVTNGLQSVQVYPNPFRPQHRFLIFDNLPQNATVRLNNPAGAVVRIFRPSDFTGNQAQWDGKNDDGKPVSAGVYLYSITSGSAIQRGKVIVAR